MPKRVMSVRESVKKSPNKKVHVIRQPATEESSSDSESPPPPPPPPGSPPPELKPYSFPGPSPGKMFLRLSEPIAMGGCRVPRVIQENPTESKPTTASVISTVATSEAYKSPFSKEKTLKLIAYHQAMTSIKRQVQFWSPSVPCQTLGTQNEKPKLPHSSDKVLEATTIGPVYSGDQGKGSPCPSYPSRPSLAKKSLSSTSNVPTTAFLDPLDHCAAVLHEIFGVPKVTRTATVLTGSSILPQGIGFPSQHGLLPPQLHNPPPQSPPSPVSKTAPHNSQPEC